jgi:WD40 repeat protein
LVASVSQDHHVRLWRRSDKKTIAIIFNHSAKVKYVAFSTDGTHIFTGWYDKKISQWTVPKDALLQDSPEVSSHSLSLISPKDTLPEISSEEQATFMVSSCCFGVSYYLTLALHVDPPFTNDGPQSIHH